jgi:hypothetical protein
MEIIPFKSQNRQILERMASVVFVFTEFLAKMRKYDARHKNPSSIPSPTLAQQKQICESNAFF